MFQQVVKEFWQQASCRFGAFWTTSLSWSIHLMHICTIMFTYLLLPLSVYFAALLLLRSENVLVAVGNLNFDLVMR